MRAAAAWVPGFFLGLLLSLGIAQQGLSPRRWSSRFTPPEDRCLPSLPSPACHPQPCRWSHAFQECKGVRWEDFQEGWIRLCFPCDQESSQERNPRPRLRGQQVRQSMTAPVGCWLQSRSALRLLPATPPQQGLYVRIFNVQTLPSLIKTDS